MRRFEAPVRHKAARWWSIPTGPLGVRLKFAGNVLLLRRKRNPQARLREVSVALAAGAKRPPPQARIVTRMGGDEAFASAP